MTICTWACFVCRKSRGDASGEETGVQYARPSNAPLLAQESPSLTCGRHSAAKRPHAHGSRVRACVRYAKAVPLSQDDLLLILLPILYRTLCDASSDERACGCAGHARRQTIFTLCTTPQSSRDLLFARESLLMGTSRRQKVCSYCRYAVLLILHLHSRALVMSTSRKDVSTDQAPNDALYLDLILGPDDTTVLIICMLLADSPRVSPSRGPPHSRTEF
jgi:hypothetical protein